MTALYNEIDPYCAEWLRNLIKEGLIPDGIVDERDIRLLKPADLEGFVQVHLFAGLGGWAYAGRLAGWPDDRPLWTGSCPCQPFSVAGKRAGFADDRHLWPVWRDLIAVCRPPVLVGEQVSGKDGLHWFDCVSADLEKADYTVAAVIIPAYAVAAPHMRERLWFLAHADGARPSLRAEEPRGVGKEASGQTRLHTAGNDVTTWEPGWPSEPPMGCLANGVPRRLDQIRALGNAIVPQIGAEILRAVMEMDG